MRKNDIYYPLSKTLAEKRAWELADELGVKLAVINPTLVVGEALQSATNTSNEMVRAYLDGSKEEYKGRMGFVDVKDVAEAHVAAIDSDTAVGQRHLCITVSAPWRVACQHLRELYPDAKVPTVDGDGGKELALMQFDNAPFVALLGRAPTPLRDMLRDTADTLPTAVPGVPKSGGAAGGAAAAL
mmetsp:Transcript_37267/g.91337  ORF Transcript_37267/g.91337 Transcript_37267/m.91337 type:complete len:185 (-) Transcript_37267:41-595(-)